ncbi:MAG: COX15/CtaA family protein [Akkermansiaceae bacterium]|jgi:cytochrome c oxidase assembly protein subunit 15|nr:COX15/CtaA family protein [Luteolibacter sp.]
MKYNLFQKLALAALISLLLLIFMGATVRVTGAGMGCPDWPTCWGLLIPPTHVEQVDFNKLPIEKFRDKAERMGRDPESITVDSLKNEFNPRHVWTEFMNRICSLPVGFFTLASFIASFSFRKQRPAIFWLSFTSLLLVLANAVMGARVVYSGLAPGVITTHLALAMILICTLTYCIWAGCEQPTRLNLLTKSKPAFLTTLSLFILIIIEGITGAQIREMTDELAKSHLNSPRETWIGELEASWLYLFHRSFSWLILILSISAFWIAKKNQPQGATAIQYGVLGIVFSQMLLGLIMAQIHIYSWVQLLHVGLASILLTLVFFWLLMLPKKFGEQTQKT